MEKCPTCERKFERLQDYPSVYVISFERLQIPEFIRQNEPPAQRLTSWHVPRQVRKKFRDNSETSEIHWEGKLYSKSPREKRVYYVSSDVASTIRKILAFPIVERTLQELEALVGKEMRTKEFEDSFGFRNVADRIGNYPDIRIAFSSKQQNNSQGIARFYVSDAWLGGSMTSPNIMADIAQLSYEGRTHQK